MANLLYTELRTDDNGNQQYNNITNEQTKIINNMIMLNELPYEFTRVFVTPPDDSTMVEIDIRQPIINSNQYKVNYNSPNAIVYFHPDREGQTMTFAYTGMGLVYIDGSRVVTLYQNGTIVETLNQLADTLRETNLDIQNAEVARETQFGLMEDAFNNATHYNIITATDWKFTATVDNTTEYDLNLPTYNPLIDDVQLFYGGELLLKGENYTLTGTHIVLGWGLNTGESINHHLIKGVNYTPQPADASLYPNNSIPKEKLALDAYNTLQSVGNKNNLTTDYRNDLVGAINEHEVQINSNTSQLADITTNRLPLKANQSDLNTTNTNVANNTVNISTLQNQIAGAVNGSPIPVTLASQMTDHARNYVYLGSESGYVAGNLYYWNGSSFVNSGKQYQSTGIADATITPKKTNFINTVTSPQLLDPSGFVYKKVPEKTYLVSAPTTLLDSTTQSATNIIYKDDTVAITYRCNQPLGITYYGLYNGSVVRKGGVTPTNAGSYYTFTIPVGASCFRGETANAILGFDSNGSYVQNTAFLTVDSNWGDGVYKEFGDTNTLKTVNVPFNLLTIPDNSIPSSKLDANSYNKIFSKATINLPPNLDFIAGEEVNLYNYGFINASKIDDVYIKTNGFVGYSLRAGKKGLNMNFSSVTAKTTFQNRLYLYDLRDGTLLADQWFNMVVNPKPANPTNPKNILFIGDSLVAFNVMTRTFIQKLVNTYGLNNFKLVGRIQDSGEPLNRYEAIGGLAWNNYVDNPANLPSPYNVNYFWDTSINDINIQKYMTTYCGGVSPDYVFCNLGWNNHVNTNFVLDTASIKVKAKYFIDKVHATYPNCKVVIGGIQGTYPYGDQNTVRDYRKYMFDLNTAYNEIATDSNYSSFVKFVNNACMFNSELGMQLANDNTFTHDQYCSDMVHPNNEVGYPMFANNYLRALFGWENA